MNLKKRIRKLQEQGKDVHIHQHSLLTFDGYAAEQAVSKFWQGACIFLFIAFVAFWWGHNIYTDNKVRSNPETAAIQAQREKDQREHDLRKIETEKRIHLDEKQQYIDGCKGAGKSPGDMGDAKEYWECR
jgi:hypothetical protein